MNSMRILACSIILLVSTASPGQSQVPRPAGAQLTPRAPYANVPLSRLNEDDLLIVKFADDAEVRVANDRAFSRTGANLAELQALLTQHAATLKPLFDLTEAEIDAFRSRAATASGRAQPDFAGTMRVESEGADRAALATSLRKLAEVEIAYFARRRPPPPCVDAMPATPSYSAQQTYLGANPGVNLLAAQTLGIQLGAGCTIFDCEYGFYQLHEDICDISIEPGQAIDFSLNDSWIDHGTAVLGLLSSDSADYGCIGMVPSADFRFHPEVSVQDGNRRHAAVMSAVSAADAGDVVLLEMQEDFGQGLGPAELDPIIHATVSSATDAGILVVAAAGNGDVDLDAPQFQYYRDYGNSHAIIVGAGTSDTAHDKTTTSSFGTRVDLHCWGEDVVTLGYGDLADMNNDNLQQYTNDFGGTSSASALMTGVITAVQSIALSPGPGIGRTLTPREMRDLLRLTGLPQGAGGTIGPFPDVDRAARVLPQLPDQWVDFAYVGAIEVGTISFPHNTMQEALDALLPGNEFITIKAGIGEPTGITIDVNATIRSVNGAVVIGE